MISLIEGCYWRRSYWTKCSYWLSWSHHFENFTVAIIFKRYRISVTNDHRYVQFVLIIIWPYPNSWLIIEFETRVTLQVPLVEQELLTFPEHLCSLLIFSGVRFSVAQSLVFYVVFCRSLFICLVLFSFAIMLSVFRRFTASVYSFCIFKIFLTLLIFLNFLNKLILFYFQSLLSMLPNP
jgi:hypothetical protein